MKTSPRGGRAKNGSAHAAKGRGSAFAGLTITNRSGRQGGQGEAQGPKALRVHGGGDRGAPPSLHYSEGNEGLDQGGGGRTVVADGLIALPMRAWRAR